MKKSMLYAGFMTILCASVYADENQRLADANTGNPASSLQAPVTPPEAQADNTAQAVSNTNPGNPANNQPAANLQASSDGIQTPTPPGVPTPTPAPQPPANTTTTPAAAATQEPATPATQEPTAPTTQEPTAPATQEPAAPATQEPAAPATQEPTAPATQEPTAPATQEPTAPATQEPAAPATQEPTAPAAPVAPPQNLDCNYRIPAETTQVDQAIVMKWAENATEQSFSFDHSDIEKQLASLQNCYTEQGWQGFNDALQKSGNLNAIQSQQLVVSSMVSGEPKIVEIKDNQWKVSLALQVVYQNDKEKLTQPLTINLVVGRKISGDLGIMQMIAVPRQPTATPSTNTAPSEAAPALPDANANSQNPS